MREREFVYTCDGELVERGPRRRRVRVVVVQGGHANECREGSRPSSRRVVVVAELCRRRRRCCSRLLTTPVLPRERLRGRGGCVRRPDSVGQRFSYGRVLLLESNERERERERTLPYVFGGVAHTRVVSSRDVPRVDMTVPLLGGGRRQKNNLSEQAREREKRGEGGGGGGSRPTLVATT